MIARKAVTISCPGILEKDLPQGDAVPEALALWLAIFLRQNVRDDRSPLTFGVPPARVAESAGGMTKVPKAW